MRRLGLVCALAVLALPLLAQSITDSHLTAIQQRQRALADLLLGTYVFIGGGSGVLVSADGLVVTNDHVAGSQARWTVRLANGDTYTARLLGTDPVGDIAVLQIEHGPEGGFPFVRYAGAADMRLGMPVFAVGNPFSLGDEDHTPTLTDGYLGAIRVVRGTYADCLQLDAPVNPGNSGGPLLSQGGALLGINGQIRTRSGMRVNSGIGLAISATQLAEFVPVLAASNGGYAHHCAIPEGLELEQRPDGVVVTASADGLPFAIGDTLLRIADRPVTSQENAVGLFMAPVWHPGRTLPVVLQRGDETVTVTSPVARTPIPGRPWHGIGIRVLANERVGDSDYEKLAIIRKVDPNSPADGAGIAEGHFLLAIDGNPVRSTIDLVRAQAAKEVGDTITVTVLAPDGGTAEHELLLRPRP